MSMGVGLGVLIQILSGTGGGDVFLGVMRKIMGDNDG